MAEAFITAAHDELSCPICLELFVDPNVPKDLPGCDHVICEVCLKKMVNALTGRKRTINCPECRKDTELPKGGVDALRTNRKVRNLAEKHPKDVKSELKDEYAVQKEEMQLALTSTMEKIGILKQTLHDIKELKNQVQQSHSTEEEKVDKSAEDQINKIREKAHLLKTQLRDAEREKQHRLDQEVSSLDVQIRQAESNYEAAINSLVDSAENERIANYLSLMDRLNRISIRTPNNTFSGKAAAVFSQEKDEHEIELGTLVHDVCVKTPEVKTSYKREVTAPSTEPVTLKLMQTLEDFQSTRIAWSPKGWLVISESRKRQITLCQKHHGMFKRHRSWKVDYSFQPGGVAVSIDGLLIYVALWTDVWAYSPTGKCVRKFRGTQDGVYSVTVTTDDKVLLGYYHGNTISEHTSRGNVLRSIKTDIKPYYITLIHETHVAMSDFESGRVSVIRTVIDMRSGQQTLKIKVPDVRGICYEKVTESLLAITRFGACVDQFDSTTGRFVARVVEGLSSAWDLALSSDKILAVSMGECIRLYQVA